MASRKDKKRYVIMNKSVHVSVIYKYTIMEFPCFFLLTLRTAQIGHDYYIYWNQCVYFFYLILIWIRRCPKVDVKLLKFLRCFSRPTLSFLFKDNDIIFWNSYVIQYINSHDKFSTFCLIPIYASSWCINLFKSD